MNIVLVNSFEKRLRNVQVEVGNYVQIQEFDGAEFRGLVSLINSEKIEIHFAQILYAENNEDYPKIEGRSEFAFKIADLNYIKVANFEEITPASMISGALNENYCGSESIVMSPQFYRWYKEYIKDFSYYHSYWSIPIFEDKNLMGICVYAKPNEQSIKHKITPLNCYSLNLYKSGKWVGTHIMSCFDDELEKSLQDELSKAKAPFGSYQLCHGNIVVERGTVKKRFPVKR